jgi:hypothetical protein
MAKKRVTTRDSGRYYFDSAGQRYWSVTTILGDGVPKKALIQWSGNEAAKYVMDRLVRPLKATHALLKDIRGGATFPLAKQDHLLNRLSLSLIGFSDYSVADPPPYKSKDFYDSLITMMSAGIEKWENLAYDQIRTAGNRTRDTAGRDGAKAHDIIESYIKTIAGGGEWDWTDVMDGINDNVAQVLARFIEFEQEWEPEWEASELTVFNPTAGYAGQLDFIARIPKLGDGLTLGDFKTGRGVFPETAMQLAAYRHAEFAESDHGKVSVEMPVTERAIVVHLRPDDANSYQDAHPDSYYEVIPMDTGEEVFDMFRYVSQVAWFTRDGAQWQHDPIEVPSDE